MIVRSLFVVLGSCTLLGCAHLQEQAASDPVISRSDTAELTENDYREYLRGFEVQQLRPLTVDSHKVRDLVLDFHSDSVLARQAEMAGVLERPEVRSKLENFRRQLLVTTLMEDVRAGVVIPDLLPLAKERYTAELDSYRVPERRRAAHILLLQDPCEKKDTGKLIREAQDLRKRALSGEDFAELARKYSRDRTASIGGVLPGLYAREGALVKPFEDAMFELGSVGEVSQPIETKYGIHLIKLLEVDPAHVTPFDAVQDKVVAAVRADMLNSAMERKRGEAYPAPDRIDYDALMPVIEQLVEEKTPPAPVPAQSQAASGPQTP